MKIKIAFFTVGVFLIGAPLEAQWVKVPPAKVPRTAEGKPNLSALAPRLLDGKPDLSGIWEPANNRYVQNIAADLKPEDVPYQPWAKALFDERKTGAHSKEDQPANCLPQGVPRINAAPAPWKLVQTPAFIAIVYEAFNLWRQIFLDGREVAPDAPPREQVLAGSSLPGPRSRFRAAALRCRFGRLTFLHTRVAWRQPAG